MYVIGAAMLVIVTIVLFLRLPNAPAKTRHTYAALMRSLVDLYANTRALRRASVTQFLLGIGYGGFWQRSRRCSPDSMAWVRPLRD